MGACRYDELLPYQGTLKWQATTGLAAGTWYVDPGNWVYSQVLHILVSENDPTFLVQSGWQWRELNMEHKGDIIECILAAAYIALDESNWSGFFSDIGVLRNDIEWIAHRVLNPNAYNRFPKEFKCWVDACQCYCLGGRRVDA